MVFATVMDLVCNKATVGEQAKNMEGMFWYTVINKHNNNPEIKVNKQQIPITWLDIKTRAKKFQNCHAIVL